MIIEEYLAGYGLLGEFGRFRPLRPLSCQRGDRIVVRSHRGLEIARVLRQATQQHAHFLPNTTLGQILRPLTPDDEQAEQERQQEGQRLLARATALAAQLQLPLELLDVEILLDGEHAVLHHLRWADADLRPFVSTLSREHAVTLTLEDLSQPREPAAEGCGREGCGHGEGGCGSSSSGGGCASCGVAHASADQARFAALRQQMERRTPLL
jgi:cell fate regulator YaaT (PSP1 superfamily)